MGFAVVLLVEERGHGLQERPPLGPEEVREDVGDARVHEGLVGIIDNLYRILA